MGLGNIGQASGTIDYNGPGPQMTFGDAGAITRDYGDDAGVLQDRANVENSLFQRFQPQNDRDLANLQSQLNDQGIKYGSPAYQAAMDNYNRGITDQRLGITAQGGAEQKLQNDMRRSAPASRMPREQQQFTENQQKGTFFDNARDQCNSSRARRACRRSTPRWRSEQRCRKPGSMPSSRSARRRWPSVRIAQPADQ